MDIYTVIKKHCHCDADIIANRDQEIERLKAFMAELNERDTADSLRILDLGQENERLRLLLVGVLYADEDAIEQARAVVERYCPACGGTQGDGTQPCAYAGCPKRE
jgi:hypothetical protein